MLVFVKRKRYGVMTNDFFGEISSLVSVGLFFGVEVDNYHGNSTTRV